MANKKVHTDVFGFIKPLVDVHTMGMFTMANLLKDCGYKVYIANDAINEAVEKVQKLNNYGLIKQWILNHRINRICFSYRLDPQDGCDYFMNLYSRLLADNMMLTQGGPIKDFSFAGLPDTCELVKVKTHGKVLCFPGNESPKESLMAYGVVENDIPTTQNPDNVYDKMRWDFAKKVIESDSYKLIGEQDHYGYATCGEDNDSFVARLLYAYEKHTLPIIRTHSGPYNPNREEALKEYNSWVKDLAQSKLLDILSIFVFLD